MIATRLRCEPIPVRLRVSHRKGSYEAVIIKSQLLSLTPNQATPAHTAVPKTQQFPDVTKQIFHTRLKLYELSEEDA